MHAGDRRHVGVAAAAGARIVELATTAPESVWGPRALPVPVADRYDRVGAFFDASLASAMLRGNW